MLTGVGSPVCDTIHHTDFFYKIYTSVSVLDLTSPQSTINTRFPVITYTKFQLYQICAQLSINTAPFACKKLKHHTITVTVKLDVWKCLFSERLNPKLLWIKTKHVFAIPSTLNDNAAQVIICKKRKHNFCCVKYSYSLLQCRFQIPSQVPALRHGTNTPHNTHTTGLHKLKQNDIYTVFQKMPTFFYKCWLISIIYNTHYTELMCNITVIYLPTSPAYYCYATLGNKRSK